MIIKLDNITSTITESKDEDFSSIELETYIVCDDLKNYGE